MKQVLRGGPAIEAALKTKVVFCRVQCRHGQLDERQTFIVRDVRKHNGELQVKILEGWFFPLEVWTDAENAGGGRVENPYLPLR